MCVLRHLGPEAALEAVRQVRLQTAWGLLTTAVASQPWPLLLLHELGLKSVYAGAASQGTAERAGLGQHGAWLATIPV